MRNDLTDVTVVLDRSGSMNSCKTDMEGGLNSFIQRQKDDPGDTNFTLVQFDNQYDFVHTATPIKDVGHCELVPRGTTALLDAVGRAITETGERLKKMPEDQRPGLVVFVIVTDGLENASKEYTKDRVRSMIQHQQDVYKWQFSYLGAGQDAFKEGGGIGIKADAIANYQTSKSGMAFAGAYNNVLRMKRASLQGQSVHCAYTPDERTAMDEK